MSKQCWECSAEVNEYFGNIDRDNGRWYCAGCNTKRIEEKRKMDSIYQTIAKKRLVETAIKIMEKQGIDMYEYRDAIKIARSAFYAGTSKFDSAPEFALAVELIVSGVKVKTQASVLGYKVDLAIPELHIIIEVDGPTHSQIKEKDALRDVLIHDKLGERWEIVRIKPNRIEKELQNILPWILDQHSKQQELRQKNDGMVPWTYNRNEYSEIIRLKRKLSGVSTK